MSVLSGTEVGPINAAAPHRVTSRRATRAGAAARYAVVAGIGLCLLLTGCTVSATGHPAAAPDLGHWQPAPILTPQLAGLLLDPEKVNSIGHTSAMSVRMPVSKMGHDEDLVADPRCLDAYAPNEAAAYQGSNWIAVNGQILDDAAPVRPQHALVQTLIGFRDADSARQFFSQSKTGWSGCANQSLTVNRPGHSAITWDFDSPVTSEATLTITQTQRASRGLTCQRAKGLANNVIIDTLWCGFDTASQASDIVAKTVDAIAEA
jgi:hypothetical protein